MKLYSLAVFIFLFTNVSTKAQEAAIIVLNVKGHIEYMKDQSGAKERLLPGKKISSAGALNLKGESKVSLLHNGKHIQLDQAGAYDLKTLIDKNDKGLSMSFAGRFWDFVNEGLSQSDNSDELNGYNEKLLAVTGGVSGYAIDDEMSLQTIMPSTGNIGAQIVTFNWHSSKNKPASYQFKIYHVDADELVFKAITRDTSITLDFSQLAYQSETSYEWNVEAEDAEKELMKSELKTFEYYPKAEELFAQKTKKLPDYKNADDFEKKWMEAIVMEQENFNFDAYIRYKNLSIQNPENLLIKKLFASFLVRQGLTQAAIDQIND